jgi:type II secretory ATPase GspE/PulE/Tfp pilus assembly ATPase PilB-like protein
MLRLFLVLAGAMAVWAIDAQCLLAADGTSGWPAGGMPFSRGTGAYLSPWKIIISWLLFLSWVRTTDWVSQDGQTLKLRWALWNPIVFFSFFVALLLLWIIPWFAVGLVLLLLAYGAPLASYIVLRNQQMQSPYDKVLSRKHLRRWTAQQAGRVGIKIEGAEIDPRDLGPDIKFTALGGATDRDNTVNLLTARQSDGYLFARQVLDDAIVQRATHVMLDYTPESVGVRQQIDGVWLDRPDLDRAQGDAALEVFKGLAALKIDDRRSRQSGTFGVEAAKQKLTCKINSQGTPTGERVLLQFDTKKHVFTTLDEIGMRTKMQEQVAELLSRNGLIIFSALPGGGLTTTLDTVLASTDRFVRNYVEVANVDKPEREIENVHTTAFSPAAGESPLTLLPKLVRTYPDVIIVRDVPDVETLSLLCEQVAEQRLIITTIRAKEAVEALLRIMMLKIPPAEFSAAVIGVLNMRLVRKLCEKCKEAYPPPAEVLKQLGLPAGRVEALYRPPTEPIDPKHPEVVCDVCQGVGYYGRTGIFELLLVDDDLRQVLTTAPKLENLRAVARKSKHRTLQDEGVLLVARGITSIQELLRTLKQ